jgi:hypothetical protein
MDQYAPFDSGPGSNVTEDGWRGFMRRISVTGVMKSILSEMQVVADSTGMQVKINPGEVWIEGNWGQISTQKNQPIAAAHATLPRVDVVVARSNFVGNQVEFDVLTGTAASSPAAPPLTRNTSMWEIPLALVNVPAAATTIAAGNVLDARQWGGPPTPTTTDDFLLYGDKLSACRRLEVTDSNPHNDGIVYFTRTHSLTSQTCSKIRMYPTTLAVGGTVAVRIFHGYRLDNLTDYVDVTTSTLTYSGSGAVNTVHEGVFPATTFRAGEVVVVCYRYAAGNTAPVLATSAPGATITNLGNLITPTTGPVTGFKTAALPTSVNLTDGTWSQRNRVFWAALA